MLMFSVWSRSMFLAPIFSTIPDIATGAHPAVRQHCLSCTVAHSALQAIGVFTFGNAWRSCCVVAGPILVIIGILIFMESVLEINWCA